MSQTVTDTNVFDTFTPLLSQPVKAFLALLCEQKNYSVLTQQSYSRQLIKLLQFMQGEELTAWSAIKTVHIRQLSAYHHRSGLSPKSIALLLSSCRSFFNHLILKDVIKYNPAKGVKAPKSAKLLPKIIEVDQLNGLLNAIDVSQAIGIRDKAVAEFFYSSGIRLAELVRLNLHDVDLLDASARITGKGDKTRIVPIGGKAITAIKEWLSIRGNWINDDTLQDKKTIYK